MSNFLFLEVILTLKFALTTNSKNKIYKYLTPHSAFALIINIFRASEVEGTFRFDSLLNVVLVVFGEYCLSLRAIISIIKRDNRFLDECFRKLKQLPISIMSSIFNLNAEFWPKNSPKNLLFLKKCSHTL